MASNFYCAEEIFFEVDGREITGGVISIEADPKEIGTFSTEDKGYSVPSFRSMKTINYIFSIEVTYKSEAYMELREIYHQKVNQKCTVASKLFPIIFNDGYALKLTSRYAMFSSIPDNRYSAEPETVTFIIKANRCTEEMPSVDNRFTSSIIQSV